MAISACCYADSFAFSYSLLQTEMQNRMVAGTSGRHAERLCGLSADGTAAVVDLLFGRQRDFHLPFGHALGHWPAPGALLYCREAGKKEYHFSKTENIIYI